MFRVTPPSCYAMRATASNGLSMQPLLLDCAPGGACDRHGGYEGGDASHDEQHVVFAAAWRRHAGRQLRDVANDLPVVGIHDDRRNHSETRDQEVPEAY